MALSTSTMNHHPSSKPSPMQPVPPPHKKQKATVDDAITRRRAQLLRLQRERKVSSTASSGTQDLLARARAQLQQLQENQQLQTQQPPASATTPRSSSIPRPTISGTPTSTSISSPPPPPIPKTATPSTATTTSSDVVLPPPIKKVEENPTKKMNMSPSPSPSKVKSPPPPPKSTLLSPKAEESQTKAMTAPSPPPSTPQHPQKKPIKEEEEEKKLTLDDLTYDDDLTLLVTPARKKKQPKVPNLSVETDIPVNNRQLLTTMRQGADTPLHHQQQPQQQEAVSRSRVLEAMRQGADTPRKEPDHPQSSKMLRLVKELKLAIQDKTKALNQVQSLESQLSETMEQQSVWTTHLEELLHQSQIHEALHFLQKQKQPNPISRGRTNHRQQHNGTSRRRMKSPEPTPRRQNNSTIETHLHNDQSNQNTQDVSHYLKQAWTMVPHQYDSEYATFVVRTSVSEEQYDWPYPPPSSSQDCQILAKIKADHSKLFLMNESQGQHVFLEDAPKLYQNMEEETLGCITYIDVYGEEKEYWLDVIYEQAMATRETFFSKLYAAAEVLQQNNQQYKPPPVSTTTTTMKPPLVRKKPIMVDASVGTENLPLPEPQPKTQQQPAEQPVKPKQSKEEVVLESEDNGSTDVLSWAVSNFFIFIFNTIWFCLVTLPLRLVYNTALLILFTVSITLLWLYLADDNGAMKMGAGIDTMFQPGIF